MVLFVANSQEDTISVIDPVSLQELDRLSMKGDVPRGPRRLQCSADALFCINAYTGTLSIFRQNTMTERRVGVYPNGLALLKEKVLVCCGESDSLWCLSKTEEEVVAMETFPISIEAVGEKVTLANMLSSEVVVLDSELKFLQRIPVEGMPMYSNMDEEGRIYCSHMIEYYGHGFLSVYLPDGTLERQLPTGAMPTTIKLFEHQAVMANTGNSTVELIDCNTLECRKKVFLGNMPDDIVVCQQMGLIFISIMMENTVCVIDFNGNIVKNIAVGEEPRGLALSPE